MEESKNRNKRCRGYQSPPPVGRLMLSQLPNKRWVTRLKPPLFSLLLLLCMTLNGLECSLVSSPLLVWVASCPIAHPPSVHWGTEWARALTLQTLLSKSYNMNVLSVLSWSKSALWATVRKINYLIGPSKALLIFTPNLVLAYVVHCSQRSLKYSCFYKFCLELPDIQKASYRRQEYYFPHGTSLSVEMLFFPLL